MGLGSAFRNLNRPLQVYIQADAAERTSRTLVDLILVSFPFPKVPVPLYMPDMTICSRALGQRWCWYVKMT